MEQCRVDESGEPFSHVPEKEVDRRLGGSGRGGDGSRKVSEASVGTTDGEDEARLDSSSVRVEGRNNRVDELPRGEA